MPTPVKQRYEHTWVTDEADAILPFPAVEADAKPLYEFWKRIFDVVFSLIALVVLSPFFLLIMLLIWLDDPKGSAMYTSTRCGKDGREFRFYKFRTMVVEADEQLSSLLEKNEMDGPAFKIKNDPRITKMGKFLRKTSLDELPQFLNVLKGDMSTVGPRPPIPREVAQYTDYEWQRLMVKPGLTCYWQVKPERNTLSFEEWMNLDIQYIRDRNFRVDAKVLMQTIRVMVAREGV